MDSSHTHTDSLFICSPYLQLSPQLLRMGGVLRQVFSLGGVGQNVDCGLCLREPFEEGLELPEGHLQALQLTVQMGVAVTRSANQL